MTNAAAVGEWPWTWPVIRSGWTRSAPTPCSSPVSTCVHSCPSSQGHLGQCCSSAKHRPWHCCYLTNDCFDAAHILPMTTLTTPCLRELIKRLRRYLSNYFTRLTHVWRCWQTPIMAEMPSSSTWPENLNRAWIWSQIFSGTMFVFSRNVVGCVMTKQCWATWMAA